MPFLSTQNKLKNIRLNTEKQLHNMFRLKKFSYRTNTDNFMRNIQKVSIDTTPEYFNTYLFEGTLFYAGPSVDAPEPESAYRFEEGDDNPDSGRYTFIYPTWNFRSPAEESPESITDGAEPWTLQTSIGVIKSKLHFPKLPDRGIDGTKLIVYVNMLDGSPYTTTKFVYLQESQDFDELSVEFSYFYRWIKLSEGYDFEFYSIFPVAENEQLVVTANLYFYNTNSQYYAQSYNI